MFSCRIGMHSERKLPGLKLEAEGVAEGYHAVEGVEVALPAQLDAEAVAVD